MYRYIYYRLTRKPQLYDHFGESLTIATFSVSIYRYHYSSIVSVSIQKAITRQRLLTPLRLLRHHSQAHYRHRAVRDSARQRTSVRAVRIGTSASIGAWQISLAKSMLSELFLPRAFHRLENLVVALVILHVKHHNHIAPLLGIVKHMLPAVIMRAVTAIT